MGVFSKVKSVISGFKKDQRGSMSIVAALSAIPLIVAGGAAIDLERALNARTVLRASLDSAALYAATLPDKTNGALTTKSKYYLDTNYLNNGDAQVSGFQVVNNGSTVTATASVSLNTIFMSLIGTNNITVNAASTVVKQGINLEVSLVLDNSGSMNSVTPGHAQSAISEAKAAAGKFVDLVMPATQGAYFTKISVIPYNNSVKPGALLSAARGGYVAGATSTAPGSQYLQFTSKGGCNFYGCSGNTSIGTITDCVSERSGASAFTDASALSAPVGYQYDAGTNPCAVSQLIPLSTNATTIKSTINGMVASNYTAGQVGVAWGWYTLSPTFGIFSGESVPAGYDKLTISDVTQRVKKIMIIMTDGEYNSAYADGVFSGKLPTYTSNYITYDPSTVNIKYPDNGYAIPQATSLCNAMKAKGVEVYVITFQLDKAQAERVAYTQSCATDTTTHLIDGDGAGLDAAFSYIANQINAMRIQS